MLPYCITFKIKTIDEHAMSVKYDRTVLGVCYVSDKYLMNAYNNEPH